MSTIQLRAAERDLRLVLDSVPGLVNTMTPAGEIEFANRQLLDYLGVGLEQLQDWPRFIHESDRSMVIERWRHSVETGPALRGGIPAPSFRRRVSLVPRSCRAGARAGWLDLRWYNLVTDIEDRKQAEDLRRSK